MALAFALRATLAPPNMKHVVHKAGVFLRAGGEGRRLVLTALLAFSLTADAQTLQDLFANREVVTTPTGRLERSNTTASVEVGEPKHGGKTGGHSLWVTWVAPTNGVAKFRTEGSGFDTLLGAYQFTTTNGTTFADLREVARADDSEGFERESEIEFGVVSGGRYEIAADGYFGATGLIEVKWEFDPLPAPPPIVLDTPADRSVKVGDAVSLLVNVTNAAGGQFKWYFNGNELAVTTNHLLIPSFQTTNVGRYKLRISADGIQYFSIPTEIQINTDGASNTLAQPKLLDAPGTPLIGGDGGGVLALLAFGPRPAGASRTADFGVVRGYNGSQIFNTTYGTTDPAEPPHCGVIGGASYWLIFQPPTNGTVTLDTLGSTYDTVMETYTFTGSLAGYADLIQIACNNDGFGSNGPARVQFPVVKSRQYVVAVDGVNGVRGTGWVNYNLNTNQLPQPPALTSSPQPLLVAAGATVALNAPVTGAPPLMFTWRKDGTLLPGELGASLVLPAVTTNSSGDYSFSATNDLGGPVSATFSVTVVPPPNCAITQVEGGVQLSFPTIAGIRYTVEEAAAVSGPWQPWPNFYLGDGQIVNAYALNAGTRFYRVRVN